MADTIADLPALAALWDADRNAQAASDVLAKSYRTAWWRCSQGHVFQRKPRMMSQDPSCPQCALGGASLADTHPHLIKRWHPAKNTAKPTAFSASHTASVWWVCEEGHAFERSPLQMVADDGCPHCALRQDSLAARFPEIAAEWHPHKNGDLTAEQVDPDHKMTAWWLCSKSHEFQASVRSRTRSHGRCPHCYGAWTVDSIRSFVRSLIEHIDVLTPSEMFALAMQAGALRGASSRAFVKALTTGRFPVEELEKFADNKPSLVDEFAADSEFTLEIQEAQAAAEKKRPAADDPFALPDAPDADYEADGDIDVSVTVAPSAESGGGMPLEEGESLPVVQTREALAALDSSFIANADAETVKFLLDSAEAKLWTHAYQDPEEAERQARAYKGCVLHDRPRSVSGPVRRHPKHGPSRGLRLSTHASGGDLSAKPHAAPRGGEHRRQASLRELVGDGGRQDLERHPRHAAHGVGAHGDLLPQRRRRQLGEGD
ncbi:MAG: zinc-ribbon domain-containing protein [Polyangiaceae bacterium]